MIKFDNVTKYFEHKGQKKYILDGASCTIPSGGNIVVLGKDGTGKSVLMKLIGSSAFPDKGSVTTDERISWPVGFKGNLINNLSGRENVEFVCMLMESDSKKRRAIQQDIQDFVEMDKYYDMPSKTYSKSMKARLSFAMTFAFDFDTYLVDDFQFSDDSIMADKAEDYIRSYRPNSRLLIASKSLREIRETCKSGLVIKDHKLFFYDNVEAAVEEYRKMFKNEADAFID